MSSGAILAGRSIHVLVVEDSTLDAELAVHELRRCGFEVFFEVVASEAALAGALGREHWDLVLSDYAMPQFDGLEALRVVRATHAHLPFILLSGVVGEETAVEAMRRGAQDYVLKDRLARLGPAVERELREADRRQQQRQAEQALETMRRQTLLVLDQLPGRVAYLSNDLKYVFVNRHYELDFGMPREQIVGQGVEKIVGTATFADVLPHLRAALAGQRVSWEREDTGNARWQAITYVPDFDIEGKVAGLVVLALDITERKHAEIAMREALSESQLAAEENLARLEAAGAVLQYSDFKQAAAAVVACCARVVGASEGHVCAQRDEGSNGGTLRAEARRTKRTVVVNPTGSASLLCAPLIDRTAVVGCLELSGKAGGFTERDVRIADAFAQIAAIALRNSHDRQELAYAEERFRNVVQTATDAVISIDHDRNIVLWNPSAERIFGYSNEEILGWTVDILVPARLRHVHTAAIARRLQAGAATLPARMIEVVAVHKDGREIPAELSLASWRSSEGDFFTAIVRDISERKGAQETERKLQERIQQAERLEAFGRIAAGVAHDFNNLLGVILGNAELALLRTLPGNSIHDELSEIAKTVHRSADITRQLLAFARRQPIQPQRVDLNATLSAMTNVLRHLAGDRIELVLRLEPALWPVRMDPSQVDQLVTNLVVNARDAIGGTGIIVLETANHRVTSSQLVGVTELAAGAYVRLSVSDDGSGMDAKTIERIFEPFFTTKVVGRGTGLGLATVYGIARQNGGGIAVHSEVGRGSRFEVHLPRCDGDRPEQLESTSCQATTASAAVGAHTILVVEDHPALLKLSTGILEGHGYAVVPTSSPTEAVRFASEHPGPIDLVLIDMLLPDMNGSDLALRIRQFRPNIRCLFTSGYAADISSGETLADGTAFLQKPVSAAALAQGVHSLLAGQPTT